MYAHTSNIARQRCLFGWKVRYLTDVMTKLGLNHVHRRCTGLYKLSVTLFYEKSRSPNLKSPSFLQDNRRPKSLQYSIMYRTWPKKIKHTRHFNPMSFTNWFSEHACQYNTVEKSTVGSRSTRNNAKNCFRHLRKFNWN